jgi:membrane protein involved in colicin uptake
MHGAPYQRPIRSRMKRELYKGRVVQACARQTPGGNWQPIVSIQLSGGATEICQAAVDEEFQSLKEANRRSRLLAERLIDECAV